MNSHKNARLTRSGRVHMIEQIARIGLKVAADCQRIRHRLGAHKAAGDHRSTQGRGAPRDKIVDVEAMLEVLAQR
ncbi:MAG: hypothetical protein HY937_08810 [Nitrosomonadales bacterium]|nr:hypothetical protein [Nitrosomonadales bacterium]